MNPVQPSFLPLTVICIAAAGRNCTWRPPTLSHRRFSMHAANQGDGLVDLLRGIEAIR